MSRPRAACPGGARLGRHALRATLLLCLVANALASPPEDYQAYGSFLPRVRLGPTMLSLALDGRMGFLPIVDAGPGSALPLVGPSEQALGYSRAAPGAGRPAWAAFTVADDSSRDDWCLTFYGDLSLLAELAMQDDSGSVRSWSGEKLARLRQTLSIDNVTVLRLPDLGGPSWTVYLRLEGGYDGTLDMRLWRFDALSARMRALSRVMGITLGMYLILILTAITSWIRDRMSGLVLGMPFALIALALIMLSFRGGGFSSLAQNGRGGLILHNALVLALAAYGAFSSGLTMPEYKKSAGRHALVALAAYGVILAVSASLPGPVGGALAYLILASASILELQRGIRLLAAGEFHVGLVQTAAVFQTAAAIMGVANLTGSQSGQSLGQALVMPALIGLDTAVALSAITVRSSLASRRNRRELQEALSRLKLSVENRLGFLSRMASSVRAPLCGVMEALDPANQGPSGLELARAECARALNLVDAMHGYARSERDDGRHSSEAFNLATVAEAALRQCRYLGAAKITQWDVRLPIIEMRNDPLGLQSLVYTVLQRAIRSPGARSMSIAARSDTHLVHLDISDDGDPPDPGDETLNLEAEMVRRLSKSLGGSLELSRRDGRNQYGFVFPRVMSWDDGGSSALARPPRRGYPDDAPEDHLQPLRETRSPGPGATLMLVDDEPVSLITMKRRLEKAGWNVEARVSARQALADLAESRRWNLVVVDSTMPEMSGYEFCRQVRKSYQREELPLIVILDSNWPEEVEEAFGSGASDYLVRPAAGPELLARVQTHLDLASGVRRELDHRSRMAEVDKLKTLGWLTAGVAHEINTPNNAALRNVPMLREIWQGLEPSVDQLSEEAPGFTVRGFSVEDLKREIPDMLTDLYMGAQHIKKIVEDLKDYARGPEPKPNEAVDVNLAVEYAQRLLRHAIAVATRRFILEKSEGLPLVRIGRLKLTQVIVNVLENALQSLPDPERAVSLATGSECTPDGRHWVLIRVRDEGTGMDNQTLANVFDPFFTTKRERGGTGLGMPVASGIVREAGGSIQLSSRPGAGTEVMIRLPAIIEGEAP